MYFRNVNKSACKKQCYKFVIVVYLNYNYK